MIRYNGREMLGFSLGTPSEEEYSAPMDLVRCRDGSIHHAGQCPGVASGPMSAGAKIAIGGGIAAAASLALWLKFRHA